MSRTASDGNDKSQTPASDGASATLRGRVEKIIPSCMNNLSDAVQIAIEGAEDLYREIRIQNPLRDADGGAGALQLGSEVEITIKLRPGKVRDYLESSKERVTLGSNLVRLTDIE